MLGSVRGRGALVQREREMGSGDMDVDVVGKRNRKREGLR